MIHSNSNNKKIFDNIKNAPVNFSNGIREAYSDIGKKLRADARRYIKEPPKTGNIYRRRIKGKIRNHRASAPGESPANMTGILRKTVDYKIKGDEFEFGAGNKSVIYAKYLEDGTKKMAARPYLIRAIKENQKNTEKDFERHILRNLEKV